MWNISRLTFRVGRRRGGGADRDWKGKRESIFLPPESSFRMGEEDPRGVVKGTEADRCMILNIRSAR